MVDVFEGWPDKPYSPARNLYLVTPDDDNDLPFVPKGLVSNDGGAVAMVGENGNDEIVTLIANVVYPYAPQRILATGTAATNIVALH